MARIVAIERKKITTERLFNLAVEEDESYVADGVVVHNCKSFIVPNLKGSNKEIDPMGLKPSTAKIESTIKFCDGDGRNSKK